MTKDQRLEALKRLKEEMRQSSFRSSIQNRRDCLSQIIPLLNFNDVYYKSAMPIADILGRPGFTSRMYENTFAQMDYLIGQAITELGHDLTPQPAGEIQVADAADSMNPTTMPTEELVNIARHQMQAGQLDGKVLKEIQIRFAYQNCPPEDKAAIGELDRSVFIPYFGCTKLPPRVRRGPGAKLPPPPAYYQKQQRSHLMNVATTSASKTHQVFVASSHEAMSQAKTLIRGLTNPKIIFQPWWETVRPGRMFLSELAQVASEVSAALFIFTPDISGTFRRRRVRLPNQNVLFELGYFFTIVKPEHIAIIKYGDTMIPSDLLGYTHITGSRFFKAKAATAPGKATRHDFAKWVAAL